MTTISDRIARAKTLNKESQGFEMLISRPGDPNCNFEDKGITTMYPLPSKADVLRQNQRSETIFEHVDAESKRADLKADGGNTLRAPTTPLPKLVEQIEECTEFINTPHALDTPRALAQLASATEIFNN